MSTDAAYPIVWDLDSLLPHPASEAYTDLVAEVEQNLRGLADDSESLPAVSAEQAGAWADFLDRYAKTEVAYFDMQSFVHCHASADAEDVRFRQAEAKLAALAPLRAQAGTNLDFALRDASDDDFEAWLAADERLAEVRFFLEERRQLANLRLPKEQELLAADLDVDGLHAWGRLYDRLSGGLRVKVMERGEVVEKSVSQVQFDSPDRSQRENNFYSSMAAWETIADSCADAVNHIAGTRLTKYRRLGLEDHLVVPLALNRTSRETLTAMWSAITERKTFLSRYFDAKASLLGIDKLAWYDQNAPLPLRSTSATLDWDEACRRCVDTFQGFSDELGTFGERALRDGWVEAENRSGKRQGGFCTGFQQAKQSRIFMTFTRSADSMATLAHELGHAYHSFVLRDRPTLLQDYPMGLAETASTFAETVLGDVQMRNTSDAAGQLQLLDHQLSDAVAFLMNIHCRFLFEDRFHQERTRGELSADRLSELMLKAQQEAYCGLLADDGYHPLFWASKLHFYITGYPFYNFPYTFGYLLSLGLYALAEDYGDDFAGRYRQFLQATGSMSAEECVSSTFDRDLTGPDFWNRSLDIIEGRIAKYCELADAV